MVGHDSLSSVMTGAELDRMDFSITQPGALELIKELADLVALADWGLECEATCLLARTAASSCRCRCGGTHHGDLRAEIEEAYRRYVGERPPSRDIPVLCCVCSNRISPKTWLIITISGDLVCKKCLLEPTTSFHDQLFPHCPHTWHDLWDHPTIDCSSPKEAMQYKISGSFDQWVQSTNATTCRRCGYPSDGHRCECTPEQVLEVDHE